MTKENLINKLKSISSDVERLKQDIFIMQNIDIPNVPHHYTELSIKTADKAEIITERLRRVVYDTTNITKPTYLHEAAENLGISVNSTAEGIVEITLPCLIPKRKQRSTTFILDPLNVELTEFVRKNTFLRLEESAICINSIYDRSPPPTSCQG